MWLPYILLGLVVAAAVVVFYLRERGFQKTTAAYERLLGKSEEMLEAERLSHRDTTDRLHASKNLPPEGVDLRAQYEERQEERREQKAIERVNGGPIGGPRRIGQVDKTFRDMSNQVRALRTQELIKEADEKRKEKQA